MKALLDTLTRAYDPAAARRFSPDALTHAGLEMRTPAGRYHWDGMKRGIDPEHPLVVFQVTLDGWGVYEDAAAGPQRLPPGTAFAAVVPSAHRYYLPDDSARWTFFWVILWHPYVARRIAERQRTSGSAGTVLTVRADSPLVARAIALYAGGLPDRFAEEAAAFEFLIAYERHVHTAQLGGDSTDAAAVRDMLLSEVRDRVLADIARPLAVEEIAAEREMSRTRFSHRFKAVAGLAPGAYMARVRLEEVAHRLVHTDATLAVIASETGFADANHLSKAFRRHFHLSPGAFRRTLKMDPTPGDKQEEQPD